jgi:basic membrane protein A
VSTYYPGGPDEAVSKPTWGSKTANEAIQKGADVIFAAAGQTGNGALETAATEREGGKEIYCIGVDVDQWETVKNARACLVSSSIKQISVSVSKLIGMAKNDTFPLGGNYNGSMELAPFHDFENKIDQSIKDKMVEIANKLKNGEIKISK